MRQDMRCEYVPWQHFYRLCAEVHQSISADGFRPDAIIGIARGGYVPARVLADFFGVMNLAALKVEHYRGTRKARQAAVRYPLPEQFSGRRVLLVDDVSDSGDTFDVALEHLRARENVGEVRTAVLHHKVTSSYVPDYFAHRIVRWRWIIYPWALAEDLETLLGKLESRPATPSGVAAYLRDTYGLKIPQHILTSVLPCLAD